MKKITLFFVALLVSMTTFAANLVGGTTVYLKTSNNWHEANARFAIYCWGDAAGDAWYDMQVTPNNPIIYSVTIPTGKDFTGFKFVRMNPKYTENAWNNDAETDHVWNETGDLTYDAAKTQYNVSGEGSWGEYTTSEKCTLTLVGDNTTLFGTAWSTDKTENDMTYSSSKKTWSKVYTLDLTGNLTGNYKVAYNHSWDYSWSNGDGDEGNTKLNLAISGEGKYRVTFTFDPATKQLSATIKKLIITIVEGTELYIQVPTTFTIASATTTFGKAASGNALGGASPITMTEVDETNQIWKVVAPAETSDSLFNVTLTDSSGGILMITNLKYDNTNNLFVLSEDVTFGTSRRPGSATEDNGTWSVYEEEVVEPEPEPEPEDNATIVEGTKLYLKSYLGVASSSAYEYKVVFGEFTVPSSGGSTGGIIRSIAETATATEVAMTTVYTKEGKYNIWEVVAPAGTSDSIFTVIISRKGIVTGYITPLKYDGEHNLFQLPDGFTFPPRSNVVGETAGEWGVYVEGVDPDPDLVITATWSIEEGATIESLGNISVTFDGVDKAATTQTVPVCFYAVDENNVETPVTGLATAGAISVSSTNATITFDASSYGNLAEGKYRIRLAVGDVYFNGDKANVSTEEYVLTFNYVLPVEPTFTVSPENHSIVKEFKEIVITYPELEMIGVKPFVGEPDLTWPFFNQTLVNENGKVTAEQAMAPMVWEQVAANAVKISLSTNYGFASVTTAGTYSVTIPAGLIIFPTNQSNRAFTLYYTVDPNLTDVENATLSTIFVQDGRIVAEGEYQIYTITGQNVTDMNGSLENGIYIVKSLDSAIKVIVK